MKRIAIGLTAYDAKELGHRSVELSANGPSRLFRADEREDASLLTSAQSPLASLPANSLITVSAQGGTLKFKGLDLEAGQRLSKVILKASEAGIRLFVRFPPSNKPGRSYVGEIVVLAENSSVRVFVQCSMEEYLLGVLSSEVPARYHLEAIKAQAIAARTYALHPRIDHHLDRCHVCDSFLCCQAFFGYLPQRQGPYSQAIEETKGQVMIFEDKPILALFSSCAGGHTENYESCFSDIGSNAFPPPPIPYLKGVPEGRLPADYGFHPDEKALASLWHSPSPLTADAWTPQFKWSINLLIDSLEANMHHVIEKMLNNSELAPFVIPSRLAIFGEIKSFQVEDRGVGGTAMSLAINTSKGTWIFRKEIVIRRVFENHEIKLPRLRSARIYFEHRRDATGSLLDLTIYGLGSGHGVGLQQTGAEGFARNGGMNCQAILNHYYQGIRIAQT
jgi:SpoIID/LytB domain protein